MHKTTDPEISLQEDRKTGRIRIWGIAAVPKRARSRVTGGRLRGCEALDFRTGTSVRMP